jgi:MFS transporter, OFA family, oxalate/formate antiporter
VLVVVMLFVLSTVSSVAGFAVGIIGIGLSFGGVMGVFSSIAADQFGTKYYGVNYGILFSGYSIAAFFGPAIAAFIAESSDGDFSRAFYIAIAISMIGATMSVAFRLITRKRRAHDIRPDARTV